MRSRGVLYMAASAFAFAAMGMFVKLATERLPTGEIVLARAIVTLVLSYVMVRRTGISPWGHQRSRLMVRGLFGFAALACYYVSIARLPLADAVTLQNTTPLITAVLAWWLLRERIGWGGAVAMAFGLGGVVLVVDPSSGAVDVAGVAVALAGAMAASAAYVTVRQLSRTEHPLVIVMYFPLVAMPLAIPWAASHFVVPRPGDLLLLVAIGVTTQIGQVFLTLGLTVERAGRAMSVNYLQVCFAMGWQLLVFGTVPAIATAAGAALIIAGTFVVSATATNNNAAQSATTLARADGSGRPRATR